MKKLTKVLLGIVLVVTLFSLCTYLYLLTTKPQYKGEIDLKSISNETKVYFDDFGVPHIYAKNEIDAQIALGYVHAQDRLWQMELIKRIAPGRLSEIFGTRALKNDTFFISLGINEFSEKTIQEMDKNSKPYQLAMAYLQGINEYVTNGKTPIEFTILGIKKEKFTLKDVLNTLGYMSFSFAMAQKTDPLLTELKNKLGDSYMKDLGLNLEFNSTKIKITKEKQIAYSQISKSITAILENSPIPPFIGSNSWVLGPQKTQSGKVLFANDPHIEYSQPGTWYEAHINCPENEIYGFFLAGTPFPLLGHNKKYAYGLTMFENDDADFFEETLNPSNANQYQTENGFVDFKIRKHQIKVKDSITVNITVKETQNGPILNSVIDYVKIEKPIAFNWIFTKNPNQTLDAVYGLSHASSVSDFEKSVAKITAPGLNIMYGDAKNNIAWITAGKLYKMDQSANPNFILNAQNKLHTKKEFMPFNQNPKAINPAWNYVYSSNNMPESTNGYNYPGYYLPEDRAKSITQIIENKAKFSVEDYKKMLLNDNSSVSKIVANQIVQLLNKNQSSIEKQAISVLKNWNGSHAVHQIAPTIYTKFIYFYLKNAFEDEMGKTQFEQFLKTFVMKQTIANVIQNKNSVWWDNILTQNKIENQSEIINKSFKETIENLTQHLGKDINDWQWGKVHQVEYKHPLGSVALLKPIFNVGVFEIGGTNEVINNTGFFFTENKLHDVKAGPSTRRIVDFNNINNSWSILPTGQSGNPMSKHYRNQSNMYIKGEFRKMHINLDCFIKNTTLLVLK